MVKKITIGVLAIQGAASEHVSAIECALKSCSLIGSACLVNNKKDIATLDGLIMPGGESTTISRNLMLSGMFEEIASRIKTHSLPIMGTCAGCILLAKIIADNTKDVKSFAAMDIEVLRNAFGRQRDSFEEYLTFADFTTPVKAVFIRAPLILKNWGNSTVLAKVHERIVAVRQNEFLALSFHPELTDDSRIHQYFLRMIQTPLNNM